MAVNDVTLDRAKRTAIYERVDRPAQSGGPRRVFVDVLLPFSILDVDGMRYVETNSAFGISAHGGQHILPNYGLVEEEYGSQRNGLISVDVPQGLNRAQPPESVLHKFGWI